MSTVTTRGQSGLLEIPAPLRVPLRELLLSIADDKFILGHRNADWTGLGPFLEEDIAFSSMAQDELSHAAALYEVLARLEGAATPDRLAYGRNGEQYRCCALVELEDGFDWAVALVRQFLCDHYDLLRLGALARSSAKLLADLGARMLAEERIHIEHGNAWIARLGRGPQEARRRMQTALDRVAPVALSVCEPPAGLDALVSAGVYPGGAELQRQWRDTVQTILTAAGFGLPLSDAPPAEGGRRGRHSPCFTALLAELTEVYRVEPDALW